MVVSSSFIQALPELLTIEQDLNSALRDLDSLLAARKTTDGVPRGNLSWPRRNIFTRVNVMKVRNLILWLAMGGSTILCIVMVFRYDVKQQQHSKILNG